jgi:signal transduction histidine kinase
MSRIVRGDFGEQNERRRIKLVNYISIISACSILVFVFYYAFLDYANLATQVRFLILFSLGALAPILLNRFERYSLAKYYIATYDTLLILFLILKFGGKIHGSHILFLLFAIIPVFIWSVKQKPSIFIYYGINISLYVLFEFFDLGIDEFSTFPTEYNSLTKGITILVSYTGATIAIILFHRLAAAKEEQLQLQKREIEKQNNELEKLNNSLNAKIKELTKHQAELNHSNMVKGKIYSVIAHDLRSPFTSIRDLLGILTEEYDELTEEEKKKYISSVVKTSNNTHSLLENLLDWSQMQSNRIVFNPEEVNLHNAIQEAINVNKEGADLKSIKIQTDNHTSNLVKADKQMLATILRNLISNAVKFTPRAGQITIRCISETDKKVRIEITDTGIGLSNTEIDKLFKVEQNFLRLGTEKEKGSGLGLIICKDFVDRHNSELNVKSTPEEGSCFYFSLEKMS